MRSLQKRRPVLCACYIVLLTLLFASPLVELAMSAADSSLDSYILLVPFIVAYLLYQRHRQLPTAYLTSVLGTVAVGGVGVAALVAAFACRGNIGGHDELSLVALAYVAFVAAGGFLFLGSAWMGGAAFPAGFLAFLVPLPSAAVNWTERASVAASTEVAALFFATSGTAFVRHGTVFELPGIVMQIGQECSGIRSSVVLFITSLLASHLFLRTTWRRLVLVAFVIPLGVLRNGFRILVIGWLCVHVGPEMIDSPIHHRGGPIFFALSLVPLFLLAWWLWRGERLPRQA